jgi:tRNA A37 N6-isopentenylltransferase MiaA
MLNSRLVDEVLMLREKYRLDAGLPSMRCVGYRQVWDMLEGTLPRAELRDRGVFATRQFAKRQLTWLKSMDDCGYSIRWQRTQQRALLKAAAWRTWDTANSRRWPAHGGAQSVVDGR